MPRALPSTSYKSAPPLASASGRGPRPPSVPRPTSEHRSPSHRSHPRLRPRPLHTATPTQAFPVPPPGPGAGSSRGVRRETARHRRCKRSELHPPEGRSPMDPDSALNDGEWTGRMGCAWDGLVSPSPALSTAEWVEDPGDHGPGAGAQPQEIGFQPLGSRPRPP